MDLLPKQLFSASMLSRLRNNLTFVYWGMLGLVLVLAGLVVKNSLNIVSASHRTNQPIVVPKGVRIDFTAYDKVIDRFEQADSYSPDYQAYESPFKTKD